MSRKLKRIILRMIDSLLIAMSFAISHIFLLDLGSVDQNLFAYFPTYLITVVLYWLFGTLFKVFSRINRYVDISMVLSVGYSMVAAFLVHLAISRWVYDFFIRLRLRALSYLFAVLLICISRFLWSLIMQVRTQEKRSVYDLKRTLVVGAGEAANILFKSLEMDDSKYRVVGAVDDAENKMGTYFHNVRVLGRIDEIAEVVRDRLIQHVIIAIPTLPAGRIEEIVRICNEIDVSVNRMPHAQDILVNGFEMDRLRDVSVADLLGREIVKLDVTVLKSEFQDKIILVTGAGGSIGSEICRQVIRFEPKKILLVGQGENSIYQIHRELESAYGRRTEVVPIIADVKDREKMFKLMAHWKPHIVYHAAAHKHVPLMEANPMEAVKNNIYGTKNVAEAAIAAEASNFVMVSTDKAVNSTNVMGASKRIMEMFLMRRSTEMPVSTARFANVAFSDGSLLYGFNRRMEKEQPLSAPNDVRRYFITPQESGELCLMSCLLGENRDVFFPKLDHNLNLLTFSEIAERYLQNLGYEPVQCKTEDEARKRVKELKTKKQYPVYFFCSDTTGEKNFEEFYIENEKLDMECFYAIGIIKNEAIYDEQKLEIFTNTIQTLQKKGEWTRSELIKLFNIMIPEFNHKETGKFLDGKM